MKKILGIILFSLVLRLVLSPFGTWSGDMGSWIGWSNRLMEVGFGKFYEAWSDYLPGYMYVLLVLGNLWKILPHVISQEVFFKLPSIFADGVTIYLIYSIVKKLKDDRAGLVAAFIYGVSPAIWGNSALWGQSDSFATLPIVLAMYFLIKAGEARLAPTKIVLAGLFLGVAAVMKPAGMFLGPLFLVYILLKNGRGTPRPYRNVLLFLVPAILVFLAAFWPFADGKDLIPFIMSRFQVTLDQYKYTSLNAFNLWAIGGGWWKDDSVKFLFLSLQQWGVALFSISYLSVLCALCKKREKNLALSAAIIFLAGFLFLTRAHERHIFPVFAFLAIAAGVRPRLWIPFIVLSLISALNLQYAYTWLSRSFEQIFSSGVVSLFSIASIGVLGWMIMELTNRHPERVKRVEGSLGNVRSLQFPEDLSTSPALGGAPLKMTGTYKKYFVAILVLGIVTRFMYLNTPPNLMFDEVYHAFTAQEMVKGNVAAWEWWNTPPPGMAYEWSHPPFAKLAMFVPLKIFGVEHAWAWRSAVALFGVGVIVLMYFVTQELFGKKAGLIAMFLTTMDGLILAQSRIGMNDIFFVFFMLCAFYLFLRKKILLTGIMLGLSISSKWTGIYGIGILGGWYFVCLIFRAKDKVLALMEGIIKGFAFFVIIPMIVYLIIYIPFFTSGHDFSKFVELQKQMWWYHTGLKATHPFQSQFWQWPLDLRPVWFWVDYKDTTTANIYNLGNPAVFWAGCLAVMVAVGNGLKNIIMSLRARRSNPTRDRHGLWPRDDIFPFLFALSGFLGFWLPWAHSPRIMFFYHFLPSLLFMIMILSWVLTKFKEKRIIISYLIIVAVLFIYFSPIWYGFPVPKNLVDQFFWIKSWR